MTDIVERLREYPPSVVTAELGAQEIERLRAELEQAERRAATWEAALRELSGEAPLSEALAQKEQQPKAGA